MPDCGSVPVLCLPLRAFLCICWTEDLIGKGWESLYREAFKEVFIREVPHHLLQLAGEHSLLQTYVVKLYPQADSSVYGGYLLCKIASKGCFQQMLNITYTSILLYIILGQGIEEYVIWD